MTEIIPIKCIIIARAKHREIATWLRFTAADEWKVTNEFSPGCPRSLLRPADSDVISVGVNLCRPHRFARPTEKSPLGPFLPSQSRDSVRERLTACLRDKSGTHCLIVRPYSGRRDDNDDGPSNPCAIASGCLTSETRSVANWQLLPVAALPLTLLRQRDENRVNVHVVES